MHRPDRIRVLIVDDSVVACRALADAVASDPALEVAGTALSGPLALRKLPQLSPDVVMLDIDMPEMDGIQTLGEIRKLSPKLPVIICSALAGKGSALTMKALLGGATDYVTKPRHVATQGAALDAFRRELIGKIKAHVSHASPPGASAIDWSGSPGSAAEAPVLHAHRGERIDVVAIGVSTGGPKAMAEILPLLPADFPVPILVVQHMPPDFTRSFAANLARLTPLRVEEGSPGARLSPGGIWIAPGGSHMRAVRRGLGVEIEISADPPVNSCRPSVDVLFQSVREAYGAGSLAVVLTGMGQDGLAGARSIREAGGFVYAQDEATSVVWGMPGSVANAGLADAVAPLNHIPRLIAAAARRGRPRPSVYGGPSGSAP